MPNVELRISEEFSAGLADIYSERVLGRIWDALNNLQSFPEMGSARVRRCLTDQYGEELRQIPISTFLIVYRYDGRVVDVLALVYGPSVV
ncbi:type II toxin-antitoxin system RelE/ParE family toxin [Thermophilibacter provencensis]|uniref:Type II toxin-antitoxin system RelE/ParE family toxin n=1 Tax=Thermophilibacter provencensis TaxID=1852386 RepID=A0ABT7V4N5_9ACTN|nr:type II toxin-antitoxin system RelE/ParE family toxin [Thermophilibacter provencensis]MDM8271563.1 type II toxin-antitoxin system RelE/ParE family toxin [Thermophilibacter provencensis]HJA29500.1 type II toxin-antitoxin system RelE/ParE family toxin [Candidatus Olsenella pullicola]